MTEGSYEFSSVLETVSATGVIILLYFVWHGRTHRGHTTGLNMSQHPRYHPVGIWMIQHGKQSVCVLVGPKLSKWLLLGGRSALERTPLDQNDHLSGYWR